MVCKVCIQPASAFPRGAQKMFNSKTQKHKRHLFIGGKTEVDIQDALSL